jgi:hypothetical protein
MKNLLGVLLLWIATGLSLSGQKPPNPPSSDETSAVANQSMSAIHQFREEVANAKATIGPADFKAYSEDCDKTESTLSPRVVQRDRDWWV